MDRGGEVRARFLYRTLEDENLRIISIGLGHPSPIAWVCQRGRIVDHPRLHVCPLSALVRGRTARHAEIDGVVAGIVDVDIPRHLRIQVVCQVAVVVCQGQHRGHCAGGGGVDRRLVPRTRIVRVRVDVSRSGRKRVTLGTVVPIVRIRIATIGKKLHHVQARTGSKPRRNRELQARHLLDAVSQAICRVVGDEEILVGDCRVVEQRAVRGASDVLLGEGVQVEELKLSVVRNGDDTELVCASAVNERICQANPSDGQISKGPHRQSAWRIVGEQKRVSSTVQSLRAKNLGWVVKVGVG